MLASDRVTDVPASEPVIRLRDVTKTYGTGAAKTQVLRGVSFDVAAGEFVALVGQSGSGKSTLLNMIGGLDQPDTGEVEVLGIDTLRASDARRAQLRNESIGFVFQAFNLLDHLNVLQNVTLPAAFAKQPGDTDARGLEALLAFANGGGFRCGLDFSLRKSGPSAIWIFRRG